MKQNRVSQIVNNTEFGIIDNLLAEGRDMDYIAGSGKILSGFARSGKIGQMLNQGRDMDYIAETRVPAERLLGTSGHRVQRFV